MTPPSARILVYGAGAVGSCLAAHLAGSGVDVTLVARGAQRAALADTGLRVDWEDGRGVTLRLPVHGPNEARGPFDFVLVTLKSTHLEAAASDLARLAADSPLVMLQNGLSWWYFEGIDSPWRGRPLRAVDPAGTLARQLDLRQIIGAVIYQPASLAAPGHCLPRTLPSNRVIVGEIDHRPSARCARLTELLQAAGLHAQASSAIRAEQWAKLQLNMIWNPLCALTLAGPRYFIDLPGGLEFVRTLMEEARSVAAAVGVELAVDLDAELRRIAGNYTMMPSMAQDAQAGRPIEWGGILGAVLEIADLAGLAIPCFRTVALTAGALDARLRAATAQPA